MASPFKRICLQSSRQRISRVHAPCQWQPARTFHTTSSRLADEALQTTGETDQELDKLAKQPGVQYSRTEEAEDLQQIDISNISSLAHRELEQHKELREMVRIAAWEMPLLSQLAKPFQPPREEQVLKWRYSTYMGESHPASRKVVVEFKSAALKELNEQQRSKLLKLAGPRYNPSTQTVKMSCESFETQAQNKRYLADTINQLIAEASDPNADSFEDIPLDLRHHKPKTRPQFPRSWIMTPERRKQLEDSRRMKMLEEGKRVEDDRLVNGLRAIEDVMEENVKKEAEPMMARAKQTIPGGKMGKKEMGQGRAIK